MNELPEIIKIDDLLTKIALKDGEITKEERTLISRILLDVKSYSSLVDDAMEDGIITQKEKADLFEGRMKILEKAYSSAREDLVITDDEGALLKAICGLVMELDKKSKPN